MPRHRPGERRKHVAETKSRIREMFAKTPEKYLRLMTDRDREVLADYGLHGLTYQKIAAKQNPPLHHTRIMQIVQYNLDFIERQVQEGMKEDENPDSESTLTLVG